MHIQTNALIGTLQFSECSQSEDVQIAAMEHYQSNSSLWPPNHIVTSILMSSTLEELYFLHPHFMNEILKICLLDKGLFQTSIVCHFSY